jgi:hypothetical protein
MKFNLQQIEKRFVIQKTALLRDLEKIEKKKRERFNHISKELETFRKRENALRQIETAASSHLKEMSSKIQSMKSKDIEDKKKINSLVTEIRSLRKEVPYLEKSIRRMTPSQKRMALKERNFSKKLSRISSQVSVIEKRRDSMQRDLNALLTKESMLKAGRIYWNAPSLAIRPKRSKAKTAKPRAARSVKRAQNKRQSVQKQNLFGKFFSK